MPWHARSPWGWFDRTQQEPRDNALMMYGYFSNAGWTLSAICGLLGSVDVEGVYNPWQYESGNLPTQAEAQTVSYGMGLIGFTPASKYLNSSIAQSSPYYSPHYADVQGTPEDGEAQCKFIDEGGSEIYFYDNRTPVDYRISYAEYKQSNLDPRTLASIWMYNAERPAGVGPPDDPYFENKRREAAAYWYRELSGVDPPDPPTPPTPVMTSKMPLWFYLKKLF